MRSVLAGLALLLSVMGFAVIVPAQATQPPVAGDIDGLWRSPDDEEGSYITVRVSACEATSEERCGIVIGAYEGANPATIGQKVVRDMELGEDGIWRGEIYQPLEDDTYYSRIELVSNDVMNVDGCIIGGLICKTQRWTRLN